MLFGLGFLVMTDNVMHEILSDFFKGKMFLYST
jgi:hypothetical protein